MTTLGNLLDPDYEPSDEELAALMSEVMEDVRAENATLNREVRDRAARMYDRRIREGVSVSNQELYDEIREGIKRANLAA